jgi:hypothetical protein
MSVLNSPVHASMFSPAPGAAAAAAGGGTAAYVAVPVDQYNQLAMACQQGLSLQGSPLRDMPVVPVLLAPSSPMMMSPSTLGLPNSAFGGYGAGLAAASGQCMPGPLQQQPAAAAAAAAGGRSSGHGNFTTNSLGMSGGS